MKTTKRLRGGSFLAATRLAIVGGALGFACLGMAAGAAGQSTPTAETTQGAAKEDSGTAAKPKKAEKPEHRFWDLENDLLFAGVGASRALDYSSTLNMRRRGRQEILITNDVVDDHAGFAALEAAGTGISIGASYLFHRYGHHKLERWTSAVHIGVTLGGAARNYSLKTAH
jgi:hypothetical protein